MVQPKVLRLRKSIFDKQLQKSEHSRLIGLKLLKIPITFQRWPTSEHRENPA